MITVSSFGGKPLHVGNKVKIVLCQSKDGGYSISPDGDAPDEKAFIVLGMVQAVSQDNVVIMVEVYKDGNFFKGAFDCGWDKIQKYIQNHQIKIVK